MKFGRLRLGPKSGLSAELLGLTLRKPPAPSTDAILEKGCPLRISRLSREPGHLVTSRTIGSSAAGSPRPATRIAFGKPGDCGAAGELSIAVAGLVLDRFGKV